MYENIRVPLGLFADCVSVICLGNACCGLSSSRRGSFGVDADCFAKSK